MNVLYLLVVFRLNVKIATVNTYKQPEQPFSEKVAVVVMVVMSGIVALAIAGGQ